MQLIANHKITSDVIDIHEDLCGCADFFARTDMNLGAGNEFNRTLAERSPDFGSGKVDQDPDRRVLLRNHLLNELDPCNNPFDSVVCGPKTKDVYPSLDQSGKDFWGI